MSVRAGVVVSVRQVFGLSVLVVCDGCCTKAWGVSGRPRGIVNEAGFPMFSLGAGYLIHWLHLHGYITFVSIWG
jgi:hypothetical protein